ncbi:MAG: hypothetical protein E6Q97_28985 [Desulfurellales bacterium]|nr:MAG: hypothetical protein E6Q97_28985 [Desulfurellales bacterium]
MGTDIHSIAQVRRNGVWETVAIGICGDPRSYNTFAMLANVRNGRGFAGIKTSDGFPFIHEPRGLPSDLKDPSLVEVDIYVRKDSLVAAWDWDGKLVAVDSTETRCTRYLNDDGGRMWLGDHSHSWCSLSELIAFVETVAKTSTVKLCGYVDYAEYQKAKAEGRDFSGWCGDVSGPSIVKVHEKDLPSWEGREPTHVFAEWEKPVLDASWLQEIVVALQTVQSRCGVSAEDVRFVYGFDS